MTIEGMRRLTLARVGLFDMSFAAGRYFDRQGSYKRLNGLPVGSVVDRSRLPDVLELAGVSEKTWENNASTWVRLRMAHRCKPGRVALFAEPQDGALASCPKCHRPLDRGSVLPAPGRWSPGSGEESSRLPGESEHEPLIASNAERTVAGSASSVPEFTLVDHLDSGLSLHNQGCKRSEIAALILRFRSERWEDLAIAGELNRTGTPPPDGFVRWTGYAVRVVMGKVTHAA
ncbi:MAG TPA: hypothetical protein VFZ75_05620 [Actinomycetota bacterium]|nr:hypothetical protein [Actinomycetota bacterium]